MPPVTAKQAVLPLPLLAKDSRRSPGNVKYPYMSSNWLGESHLMRYSTSSQSFKSRLITHASHVWLTGPVLPRSNIPFQNRKPGGHATQMLLSASISASSNVRCRAAQTQTVERKSAASSASAPGKEKLPMLDDGGSGFRGTGFTPYYRGDDSGGNGGGGGSGGFSLAGGFPWGDFWFFMFLFLLRFVMMNVMQEGHYSLKNKFGKKKPIRRFL